jgi:4-amino-4-deoxy-L-arabinose transferase-like glycosyltransferase
LPRSGTSRSITSSPGATETVGVAAQSPPPNAIARLRAGIRADRAWLLPLIGLFVAKGVALAIVIGPFTGHDEVDHFFYIERLAGGDGLGAFRTVLLPPEAAPYQAYVADFPYNAEVIQPPLYHLALAPLDALLPGTILTKLLVLRLVSVVIGTSALVLTFALARELLPEDWAVRAGATAFVALQPQFAFEAAIVNHDTLVIALATLLMWLAAAWRLSGYAGRRLLWLGVVLGAGILTKTSFGLMIPVLILAMLLAERRRGQPWRAATNVAAIPAVLGLAIASPWFIRGIYLYGDPTGARELRSIPGFADQAMGVGEMLRSEVFWRGRLEDFWGNYGWRLIPYDPGTYRAIYALWAPAAAGLFVLGIRALLPATRRRSPMLVGERLDAIAVLLAWSAAMIGGVFYVGTIQFTQSRFAFPAMAAFGMLTALGYTSLLPARLRWVVPPLMTAGLIALNVVIAIRFLMPFYAGSGGSPGVVP